MMRIMTIQAIALAGASIYLWVPVLQVLPIGAKIWVSFFDSAAALGV